MNKTNLRYPTKIGVKVEASVMEWTLPIYYCPQSTLLCIVYLLFLLLFNQLYIHFNESKLLFGNKGVVYITFNTILPKDNTFFARFTIILRIDTIFHGYGLYNPSIDVYILVKDDTSIPKDDSILTKAITFLGKDGIKRRMDYIIHDFWA